MREWGGWRCRGEVVISLSPLLLYLLCPMTPVASFKGDALASLLPRRGTSRETLDARLLATATLTAVAPQCPIINDIMIQRIDRLHNS